MTFVNKHMDIKRKIFEAIKTQLRINNELQKIQANFDRKREELQAAIGGMTILSELYQEETGLDLQQEINTNPEFKTFIDSIRDELQDPQSVPSPVQTPQRQPQPKPQPANQLRRIKKAGRRLLAIRAHKMRDLKSVLCRARVIL